MVSNTLRADRQAEIDPERKNQQEPTTNQMPILVLWVDFRLSIGSESVADHPTTLENIFYG